MSKTTGVDPAAVGVELRIGRLSRENAETKARRLLIEGRVVVQVCGSDRVKAVVRGDSSSVRLVQYDGSWSCSCIARWRCSHVRSVQLITAVES
jgi:hypothetical protein